MQSDKEDTPCLKISETYRATKRGKFGREVNQPVQVLHTIPSVPRRIVESACGESSGEVVEGLSRKRLLLDAAAGFQFHDIAVSEGSDDMEGMSSVSSSLELTRLGCVETEMDLITFD